MAAFPPLSVGLNREYRPTCSRRLCTGSAAVAAYSCSQGLWFQLLFWGLLLLLCVCGYRADGVSCPQTWSLIECPGGNQGHTAGWELSALYGTAGEGFPPITAQTLSCYLALRLGISSSSPFTNITHTSQTPERVESYYTARETEAQSDSVCTGLELPAGTEIEMW